jgi:hypothetical protein
MAPPRRIDPLNPIGSLGPPRLGQGVPGGIRRLSPSLINPLNPVSSMNAARRAPKEQLEQKWDKFRSYPRPMVAKLVGQKRSDLISSNWDPDRAKLSVKEIADLRKMGVDKDMIPLLQDVVEGKREFGQGHNRHRSMLTTASRALGVLEAAPAGFFSATEKYQREHGYKGRLLDYVSHPSRVYKELGAGFSEVPTAVREGKTYAELLRETTDKNSITHKWAMPIGLGMSIFFDPTTYLTFGATSASKTAAYHLLAQADKAAHGAATQKVIQNFGKNVKLSHGEVVRANWKNYDEIVADVKIASGSPIPWVMRSRSSSMLASIRRTRSDAPASFLTRRRESLRRPQSASVWGLRSLPTTSWAVAACASWARSCRVVSRWGPSCPALRGQGLARPSLLRGLVRH